ncbi:MAG: hypothetical protein ACUVQW_07165, partial [Candidatus Bathycorpusculaceae bacterium]
DKNDIEQLKRYVDEIGEECVASVLIAEYSPKKVEVKDEKICLMNYEFEGVDLKAPRVFDELLSKIRVKKS